MDPQRLMNVTSSLDPWYKTDFLANGNRDEDDKYKLWKKSFLANLFSKKVKLSLGALKLNNIRIIESLTANVDGITCIFVLYQVTIET